jgi:hypothetical protein
MTSQYFNQHAPLKSPINQHRIDCPHLGVVRVHRHLLARSSNQDCARCGDIRARGTKEPPAGNYLAGGLFVLLLVCRYNRHSAAERHSQRSHIWSTFVYKNHNKMKKGDIESSRWVSTIQRQPSRSTALQ